MRTPEHDPRSYGLGDLFSSNDFYNRAIEALLRKEQHGGDGYWLQGELDLYSANKSPRPGYWTLNDKYSHDSSHYDLQRAPSGIDPEELRRLQQAAQSILYIQLYRAGERGDVHSYYQICHPEELRSGSETHADLYGDEDLKPTYTVPEPWPEGEPFIGHVQEDAAAIISHPSSDMHLGQIYVSLPYK